MSTSSLHQSSSLSRALSSLLSDRSSSFSSLTASCFPGCGFSGAAFAIYYIRLRPYYSVTSPFAPNFIGRGFGGASIALYLLNPRIMDPTISGSPPPQRLRGSISLRDTATDLESSQMSNVLPANISMSTLPPSTPVGVYHSVGILRLAVVSCLP